MMRRPLTVTIIALLLIAVGAIGFTYHFGELGRRPFPWEAVWVELVRLLAIVIGVFMLRGQNWARWLAVAWIAFHTVIGFLNTWQQGVMHALFLALFTWFLFQSDANRYFLRSNAVGD